MKTILKTTLFISIILSIVTACDPIFDLRIHIENKCDAPIAIRATVVAQDAAEDDIVLDNGVGVIPILDTIQPQQSKMITSHIDFGGGFKKQDIAVIIHTLKISKNEVEMANPLDLSKWQFVHTSRYTYDATLTVLPADFGE
ncbi:MAG: hypothetical protein LBU90_10945 [Bacteroidales bacterium]|jgi:hypothetical protein|nr:hypothetical protein [Bacteroidales bacterium]